ncbi:CBL-interacting protein kinase 8-like isoform X1 [Panicum virgatum]|uniref:CBL-interacting protein kinase 8-like isoform X1 n=1 Tax=Panicum virgatum TaxID=38727 RepID=UPI0019D50D72|nr:CBL-interacting protein kinase 8-like isoform X1 [Panicum virgatum]
MVGGGGGGGGALRRVGKYEVGRTIGEGTFAKVKFAQNTETGESVAMKVLDRSSILKHKMAEQIKREISIMKLVRHPNVVRLHEARLSFSSYKPLFNFFPHHLSSLKYPCCSFCYVQVLASRKKIFIILEFITGGELFDKIIRHGRLNEADARRYFQQLIDGVDFCHNKGVYHRDLKPENLLLDSQGNLKISDFGLSAWPAQGSSLLRTTCGTPNYVAPEVLSHKGYNGALADTWSCGVILYVLLAGFLPFDEVDLTTLYGKIESAEYSFPPWFTGGAKSLIRRILDPNPDIRIRIEEIRNDEWFQKNYEPIKEIESEEVNLDDVNAAFDNPEEDNEDAFDDEAGPLTLNAFDLIILSRGLNLAALFDRRQDYDKLRNRFLSRKPAKVILSSMEVVAQSMGFKTHIRNYKMRVEGLNADKTSHLSIMVEVFEVAPSIFMVELQRAAGDTSEYNMFVNNYCSKLDDIIWKYPTEKGKSRISRLSKC